MKNINSPAQQNLPRHQDGTLDDLRSFVALVMDHAMFIFSITALVLASTSIFVYRLPDVYTASTKLLVSDTNKNPMIFKEISDEGDSRPKGDTSQIEILTSRPVLMRTVSDLKLDAYYGLKISEVSQLAAADQLQKSIDAKWVRNTQVVVLSAKDKSAAMSSKIANSLAQSFIKEVLWRKMNRSEQILKWLPGEGAQALSNTQTPGEMSQLDDPKIVESLPSVMNDPVVSQIKQQLVTLDSQQQELSKRYKEKHPKMKELNAKIAYLKSEMKIQTDKIIMNLKAGLTGAFGVNNIQVIEEAELPLKPSGPKRLLIILGAAFGSFFLSAIFMGIQRKMNLKIRSSESLGRLWIPFLGYLPTIGTLDKQQGKNKISIPQAVNFQSREWDEVINFKSSVVYSLPAERKKFILLTSVLPNEGKSTVSSFLAISLAQMGEKVLLVDLDMRRPSIHEKFGVSNECGLSNYLVGAAHLKDAIRPVTEVPKLDLLTSGQRTPNPAMLLLPETIDRFLGEVGAIYDKVIIDAPPALHIPDALALVSKVHGTLLVVQSGKVHEEVARKLIDKIKMAGGEVIGAVINQSNLKELGREYYKSYNEYSRYYKHFPTKK